MHMQEIANTCMSNNLQLLCASSSRGRALQQHPFPHLPIFLQGRQCLVPQHSLTIQDIFTLVGARVVKFWKTADLPAQFAAVIQCNAQLEFFQVVHCHVLGGLGEDRSPCGLHEMPLLVNIHGPEHLRPIRCPIGINLVRLILIITAFLFVCIIIFLFIFLLFKEMPHLPHNFNLQERVDFQSFAASSPCSLLISFFMCIRIHFVVTLNPLALFVRISVYSCLSKRGYLPGLGFRNATDLLPGCQTLFQGLFQLPLLCTPLRNKTL